MPISTTNRKAGPYPGNGVARDFSFNFKIFNTAELRVSITSGTGLEQVLLPGINYSVALNHDQDADAGGVVTLNTPLPAGSRLVILSNVPALQPIDMTNQGGFYPDNVNEGFDRATALIQQFDEKLGRAITVPPSMAEGNLQLPEPQSGQIIAWNDNGGLSNLDPSGLVSVVSYGNSVVDLFEGDGTTDIFLLSASPGTQRNMRVSVAGVVQAPGEDFEWGGGQVLRFSAAPPASTRIVVQFQEALVEARDTIEVVRGVAGLRGYPRTKGVVIVDGRDGAADGYEGIFQWVPGDKSAEVSADPEGGVWVSPDSSAGAWRRVFHGPVDPVWFGGRTSAAIQAALDFAKINPKQTPVRASGVYFMSATVRYEGAYDDGIIFDGLSAEFRRSSDYGRTFYISGLIDGRSLDRTTWKFGRFVDVNDSMTVANSRCHVTFDHVNFLEYQIREIVGGCAALELLGCATTKPVGVQSWRMIGPYRGAGSRAMTVGRSEIATWAISGDHHGLGSTDIYCGRARQDVYASTVGTSVSVNVDSVADLAVGQLVSEHGLNGYNAYAKIPKGTTITAVDSLSNTITLSAPVDLSGGSVLVSYEPALDYGIVVELADGIWDNEMAHVMFHKEAALYIHAIASWPLWNIRIKIMGDWSPGDALRVDGDGQITDGYISLHHPYNGRYAVSIASTFTRFRVFSTDQGWSTSGVEFDGTVKARDLVSRGEFGYSEHSWELDGVKRWNQYANANTLSMQARDGSGAVTGNVYDIDQVTGSVALKWPVQHVGVSVAALSAAPFTGYLDGTEVLCYNCRVLTEGGALEPAASGTGSKVWKRLGKWYVVGTNVEAQA